MYVPWTRNIIMIFQIDQSWKWNCSFGHAYSRCVFYVFVFSLQTDSQLQLPWTDWTDNSNNLSTCKLWQQLINLIPSTSCLVSVKRQIKILQTQHTSLSLSLSRQHCYCQTDVSQVKHSHSKGHVWVGICLRTSSRGTWCQGHQASNLTRFKEPACKGCLTRERFSETWSY